MNRQTDNMITGQEFSDNTTGEQNEVFWYENDVSYDHTLHSHAGAADLQLAAELGRTLLERNKDLESQLRNSLNVQQEQEKEIQLLARQVDILRNVNESRMKIYEEVDKNLQDLEKSHDKLKSEARAEKDKSRSLSETVDVLESRCAELTSQVSVLEAEQHLKKREYRRASSVPSLRDAVTSPNVIAHRKKHTTYDNEFSGIPADDNLFGNDKELMTARTRVQTLETQLRGEQKRRELLTSEVGELISDKRNLEDQLVTLEQDQQRLTMLEWQVDTLQQEKEAANRLCRMCGVTLCPSGGVLGMVASDVEHDDLNEIKHGEVIRLKSGGSVYGSRESLNQLGLEAEDEKSLAETCAEIAALGQVVNSPTVPRADGSPSLLGEMEEQYRSLVRRYEYLVDMKAQQMSVAMSPTQQTPPAVKSTGTPSESDTSSTNVPQSSAVRPGQLEVQPRVMPLDLKSPVDPLDGHFVNGPPQYKMLFKEIFETLKRSVDYDHEERESNKVSDVQHV